MWDVPGPSQAGNLACTCGVALEAPALYTRLMAAMLWFRWQLKLCSPTIIPSWSSCSFLTAQRIFQLHNS